MQHIPRSGAKVTIAVPRQEYQYCPFLQMAYKHVQWSNALIRNKPLPKFQTQFLPGEARASVHLAPNLLSKRAPGMTRVASRHKIRKMFGHKVHWMESMTLLHYVNSPGYVTPALEHGLFKGRDMNDAVLCPALTLPFMSSPVEGAHTGMHSQ